MSYLDFRASHRFPTGFRLQAEFQTDQLVTALCGPSGSGKTTILEMIAGLKQPQQGRIEVGRKVVLDRQRRIMVPPERRRIGFVFQDRRLFPHLTVGGNLRFGQGPKDPAGSGLRFDRLVEVLDLGHLLERYPRNLSGGEQQRVALGRAPADPPGIPAAGRTHGRAGRTLAGSHPGLHRAGHRGMADPHPDREPRPGGRPPAGQPDHPAETGPNRNFRLAVVTVEKGANGRVRCDGSRILQYVAAASVVARSSLWENGVH